VWEALPSPITPLCAQFRSARDRLRGWGERSATFLDPTITYAEVREQTPPLTRKDNQKQLPHLWKPPPDPEMRSHAGSSSHGASVNRRLAGATKELNTQAENSAPEGITRTTNAEAAWNGESWKAAARAYHADQRAKNKPPGGLVLSKSFALAQLRVAFLRALLIREDIRAVGLALAGDLITPEQALDHLDDIMQHAPESCLDSHDHPTALVATFDMLTKGEGAS